MEWILDFLMPEYCILCGAKGKVLCEDCKRGILAERDNFCLECGNFIEEWCFECRLPYGRSFAVGFRDEAVGKVAERLKFGPKPSLVHQIVDILVSVLPDLAPETVIVPVPTVGKHVRVRGLDHTKRVARRLAKVKGCRFLPLLQRKGDFVQVGADARTRLKQAQASFGVDERVLRTIGRESEVFLYDDISTTGSTLKECAKLLRGAGLERVSVIVLAKNR
jgi:predicted amidophosphoribosyltransferase